MRMVLALLLCSAAPIALCQSFHYTAPVLEVQKIGEDAEQSNRCNTWRAGNLLTLLSWDLDCQVVGKRSSLPYRVTYEVDGHQFVTMRAMHPGKTVDVLITARGK